MSDGQGEKEKMRCAGATTASASTSCSAGVRLFLGSGLGGVNSLLELLTPVVHTLYPIR